MGDSESVAHDPSGPAGHLPFADSAKGRNAYANGSDHAYATWRQAA